MKVSKISNVQGNGTWTSKQDGATMYQFDYEFEDGTQMQASHKSQGLFNIGDEVEYTVKFEDPKYGKKGSVKKVGSSTQYQNHAAPSSSGSNFDTVGVEVGHAINNAVQLAIASGDMDLANIEEYAKDIIKLSRRLKKQINDHTTAATPEPVKTESVVHPIVEEAIQSFAPIDDEDPF